jgi:flavin reductase (DIM6/NTAB) family NADH-FMN oxidoreductase RutF
MAIDQREYRNTIGLFATGVTIVSVRSKHDIHGMTANALTSLSLDPLLLLVCIDRRAEMAELIGPAGRFAVSILRADQEPISRHFAGQPQPDMSIAFNDLAGAPALRESLAALSCSVEQILDGGDHLIVIGRVEALRKTEDSINPLIYFGGKYRHIAA